MKDLSTVGYNALSESIVDILCNKTQNPSRLFFRVQVAYYFAKLASMQRATIYTHDRGKIPINMYAMNLAASGFGKGYATNIMEEQVINQFRERFLEDTFPVVADKSLAKLALKRSMRKQTDEDDERIRVDKEFEMLGELAFSCDSGTPAALKQFRQKLLMADIGSMNIEIDEIGSNLIGQSEILTTLLELADVGKIKQKLTKNTAENKRSEEIDGRTPTNLMMFGTPAKLFNGGKVEEEWYSFLETGYARRCIFGLIEGGKAANSLNLTPKEIYDRATDKGAETLLRDIAEDLGGLGDIVNFGKSLTMTEDVALLIIEYTQQCERQAEKLGEFNEVRKAEVMHRYFKMLKLAGAYAFVEGNFEITEENVYEAIKVVEESGEAFSKMLTRDRNYVKLAKYFAAIKREVTHVDLVEELPFYKGSDAAKRELLMYATSWGYTRNIIIKRRFVDGIEFMTGESLEETNQDEMVLSYSGHQAYHYENVVGPFDEIVNLVKEDDLHWVNHHLVDGGDSNGHRVEENAIPGFNMVVIDVDEGVTIEKVKLLMKDYKYIIHTTANHQKLKNGVMQGDRFRLIMPLSHKVKLDRKDFSEFMDNVFAWLPFECDTITNQRARKWATCSGTQITNDGESLDALLFIPKTSKCTEFQTTIADQQSLSNLERWFTTHTSTGNRNQNLMRYAFLLVDAGQDIQQVQTNVLALNQKLPDKMEEQEILSTIMITAQKRAISR